MLNHGRLRLRDVEVRGNTIATSTGSTFGQGAGIWNDGRIELDRVTIADNSTRAFDNSGAGLWTSGNADLDETVIRNNTATGFTGFGGGVVNGGTALLDRTDIVGNSISGSQTTSDDSDDDPMDRQFTLAASSQASVIWSPLRHPPDQHG